MEQLDVILLVMRAVAMTFFLLEALHLFVYARNSHIYRVYGTIQLGLGALFVLTIYSSYFSETPLLYSGQMNLLWNLLIPAVMVMCYELLLGRRVKWRYVLMNNLPFLFAFLFYSVNNNQTFLHVVGWLSLIYATIAVIVLQVMMVKEIRRHEIIRERHAYVWFTIVMWAMYISLILRFAMYNVDIQFERIITIVVLILVYGFLTLLLRRGMLDFHQLQQEEVDEPEPAIEPSKALQPVAQPRMVLDRPTEQPYYMQDQVSFFGDKARQLNELMESKRLYLQSDLSVATLAMELGTNRT